MRWTFLRKGFDEDPILELKLKDATLVIRYYEDDAGGVFGYKISSDDFATLLFAEFANILNLSFVSREDFRKCANPTCPIRFVSLRKPRPNTPSYCTNRFARIVAARNYRKKKAAAKRKVKKKKPK